MAGGGGSNLGGMWEGLIAQLPSNLQSAMPSAPAPGEFQGGVSRMSDPQYGGYRGGLQYPDNYPGMGYAGRGGSGRNFGAPQQGGYYGGGFGGMGSQPRYGYGGAGGYGGFAANQPGSMYGGPSGGEYRGGGFRPWGGGAATFGGGFGGNPAGLRTQQMPGGQFFPYGNQGAGGGGGSTGAPGFFPARQISPPTYGGGYGRYGGVPGTIGGFGGYQGGAPLFGGYAQPRIYQQSNVSNQQAQMAQADAEQMANAQRLARAMMHVRI